MWRWLRPRYTGGQDRPRDEEGEPPMTIQRMDHVGVVVDDLEAAIAFFGELGLDLEGEAPIEGRWVDRLNGLDGVRVDIAMMRTPDGHGRLELTKCHTRRRSAPDRITRRTTRWACIASCSPSTTSTPLSPGCGPTARNSSAGWRSTRTATGSATSAAPRGSSSRWPSSSANGPSRPTCDQPERSAWMDRERQREE